MKNQITSKILKFAFAFMFILIAASCSEDNDAMDAAELAQEQSNSDGMVSGRPAVTASYTSVIDYTTTACVDVSHAFTLSGWNGGAALNVQIYDVNISEWVTIDNFNGQNTSPQTLNYTFLAVGVYQLRYQISGSAANGGTNGFRPFEVTVVDCSELVVCIESAKTTAYAGNNVGGTVTGAGGNNAWWFAFDIGDGLSNVTANIFESRTNDIGDVTYNAVTKMITITFANNWFLATGETESVKWYSYANGSLPTNGRPTPGQAPNKGTSLSFPAVLGHQYYAIHLDVATCL
ncbi:hypothetical protein [Lutibacter sp.]|uniref:hypothetical protein n=1 Tax=Lutibacter sp. TaxID=1925666 RepID=UPI0027370B93|nr:hypothetical protein [Lutibacter sp.]MDP3313061.1 hypothetical protein [Lutibacter sp.]